MTVEAEKLLKKLLAEGKDPLCGWCQKKYSEHTEKLGEIVPRVPCCLLKDYFYPV